MDNNLDRSVRLLEDALTPSGRGLLKKKTGKSRREGRLDFSVTLVPYELDKLWNTEDTSAYDDTIANILQANKSITGSVIQANNTPWKAALDSLCTEFFEVLQSHSGGHDILDVVSDLARCCSDALKVVQGLKSKVAVSHLEEEIWLANECNTWRLIFVLYQDRLLSHSIMEEEGTGITEYFGESEKLCIQNLFKRDSLVRESQLIIDWLERNAAERDDDILHFADNTVGWENSLHQLQSADTIAFSSSRQIITQLDPDAPHTQNKPLHDLDMEDEKKLSRRIFTEIRCGKMEEAQKLSRQYGHSWKAAIFEGWRLYHDPNIKEGFEKDTNSDVDDGYEEMAPNELKEIEGNYNRDIWKNLAIKYCKQEYLSEYERAAVASFCGCLQSILPVCYSWEDNLWAYMKCMVDIRVESEIRDYCMRRKEYISLPEEYWAQRMSVNEIFTSLNASKNPAVREESRRPEHIIQKCIILDEIPNLLCDMEEWIEDVTSPTYLLRFFAHLVLFLDQIGQRCNKNTVDKVVETYIKRLMEMNETQLVAYYVSKLNTRSQIQLYSQYLERIIDNEERRNSLIYAEECDLDVLSITKQVVENIRNIPHEIESTGNLQQKITDVDRHKIAALDWLTFYESQRVEVLIQSNALIFTFLSLGKIDAARLAFNKIPSDTVDRILSEGAVSEELNQSIKEHFGYKAYLDAIEAFDEWFKQYKCKPVPPNELPENIQFSEKVAYQHRVSQYKAEMERWKLTTSHLAKNAKTMLYNVLLFPGGWIVGAKDGDYLRSTCIPEVILLLYSVLSESSQYEECVQLADIIASEKHCIYKVYSREKLEEILTKLCEVSVILLNAKKDPWGNETSA